MCIRDRPLLIELKRIGNNLNQITAKINAGAFRSYNFEDMIQIVADAFELDQQGLQDVYKRQVMQQ